MGGTVSSAESNDELVDNLKTADYIKSRQIERVFRAVDRGFYFTKPHRPSAYKDLAWKDGNLHISAPCIYTEVMENLDVKPGLSFLNIGSGTGYFSTCVGLLLGRTGINHGIEVHEDVVEYARVKLARFLHSSPAIDLFDFAPPEFSVGNIYEVLPGNCQGYDRIYCGAACTKEEAQLIVNLLKVGGVSIIPVREHLVQFTRSSASKFETKNLLNVSFASLLSGNNDEMSKKPSSLPGWNPRGLKELCRAEIRDILRKTMTMPTPSSNRPETRKRRVIRRRIQRRANRLLFVQRRRREFQGTPFVESSSEEDDESGRSRSPSAVPSTPKNGTVATSSKGKADTENGHDSGTESAEPNSMPYPEPKENVDGAVPMSSNSTDQKEPDHPAYQESETVGCSTALPSVTVSKPGTSKSETNEETGSSLMTEKPGASRQVTNTEDNGNGNPFHTSRPAGHIGGRCPKTVRILEQIRELVRRRQQARRANDGEEIEAAIPIDEPEPEPENGGADGGEEVMEFDDCLSTSDDDSSSSSSSDSDDSVRQLMIVGNSHSNGEQEDEEGQHDFVPIRRIRRFSVRSSEDENDSMDIQLERHFNIQIIPRPNTTTQPSNGRTNIEIEIGELEEEMSVNVPMTNTYSIQLKNKIDLLPLPQSVKNFLNFGRV